MDADNITKSRRKSYRVKADPALVAAVRSQGGDLSALLEEAMVAFLKERELQRWKEESRQSFDSYNRMVEESGLLSDDLGLL